MGVTYKKIASVTVGSGGAANIDFTSIPSTYTDLVLKLSTRATADTVDANLRFNGATTNRSGRRLAGSGSAATSATDTDIHVTINRSTYTASTFANIEIYIPNYAGSTNKSVSIDGVTENNATASYAFLTAGLWSQTTAINQITYVPSTGNVAEFSTAVLYGISKS